MWHDFRMKADFVRSNISNDKEPVITRKQEQQLLVQVLKHPLCCFPDRRSLFELHSSVQKPCCCNEQNIL